MTRLMQVIQAPLRQQIRANVERVEGRGLLPASVQDHHLVLKAIEAGKPSLAISRYDAMLKRAIASDANGSGASK